MNDLIVREIMTFLEDEVEMIRLEKIVEKGEVMLENGACKEEVMYFIGQEI